MDLSNSAIVDKGLLKDLLAAYHDSTGMELEIGNLKKSADDASINAFLNDIKRVLTKHTDELNYTLLNDNDDVLDYRTVYKIFRLDGNDISQKNRRKLNDYIYYAKYKPTIESQQNLSGAYLIDNNFKIEKSKYSRFDALDFYMSKGNKDIQWAGVIKGYDVERSIYLNLKKAILLAFNSKNSKVCAAVLGPSGEGKSTILRKLALECIQISTFKILWINNIVLFNNKIESVINPQNKYLIIIEDWSTVKKLIDSKVLFLSFLSEFNNIRVVIGDYEIDSDYEDYIYGENIFHLKTEDNEEIIKQIILNVEKWREISDKMLFPNKGIFKAPLYMILFVIARTFSSENPKFDILDVLSEFKKIVKADMRYLYSNFKGLALAMYYWAWIYKKYSLSISWLSFLKIADHYNGNNQISSRFYSVDVHDTFYKTLLHYISFESLIIPKFDNVEIVEYHHQLLIDQALTLPINKALFFNQKTEIELLALLVKKGDTALATDLYRAIENKNPLLNQKWKDIFTPWTDLVLGQSFMQLIYLNDKLVNLYNKFDELSNKQLEEDLLYIINEFHYHNLDTNELNVFFENLINLGCANDIVSTLYEGNDDYGSRIKRYFKQRGEKYVNVIELRAFIAKELNEIPEEGTLETVKNRILYKQLSRGEKEAKLNDENVVIFDLVKKNKGKNT